MTEEKKGGHKARPYSILKSLLASGTLKTPRDTLKGLPRYPSSDTKVTKGRDEKRRRLPPHLNPLHPYQ